MSVRTCRELEGALRSWAEGAATASETARRSVLRRIAARPEPRARRPRAIAAAAAGLLALLAIGRYRPAAPRAAPPRLAAAVVAVPLRTGATLYIPLAAPTGDPAPARKEPR